MITKNSTKTIQSNILLMLTAFIWGMCFVAQRSGMESVGPFIFNGIRELLGALTLVVGLVLSHILRRMFKQAFKQMRQSTDQPKIKARIAESSIKQLIVSGVSCGVILFAASNLQQIGMVYTAASKAGFITTLYIVLVPIIGLLFKQRTHWNTWLGVAIAIFGLYLLCINQTLSLQPGDAILLVSAVFWASHILIVGHFAPSLNGDGLVKMCAIQFATAGILSLICAPIADGFFVAVPLTLESLNNAAPEIAYAGILSTGLAFTLQAIGQRHAKPQPAAVIMSLESVFGLLGGVILLGEIMSGKEIFGCVLMFIAVIIAQITFKRRQKPDKQLKLL